ncbi:MAG TPA: YdeI/OmpD-associated family protein [Flavitalea sp.]|nr:YdeI/OmpD-associated family protein [Flavitalea sp.]
MATFHPDAKVEITKYIDEMPAFSKAICGKLRKIILDTDPAIQEDWKWGPHYYYEGMVCGYGAFKQHVKLTFFNGCAMKDERKLFNHCVDNEFSRSIKYTDISELEDQLISGYIRESMEVNRKGFKREVKNKVVEVPAELLKELKKNKAAFTFFENLSYGYKKDYVELVTTAKREETRNDRIKKIVASCAQGMKPNDKYKK